MLTVTLGLEASGKSSTWSPLGRAYSVMPSTAVILRTPSGRAWENAVNAKISRSGRNRWLRVMSHLDIGLLDDVDELYQETFGAPMRFPLAIRTPTPQSEPQPRGSDWRCGGCLMGSSTNLIRCAGPGWGRGGRRGARGGTRRRRRWRREGPRWWRR